MNTCWQLKVELLTPLHVGTGNKLLNECDYVKKGASVLVVDQTHLFQSLANSQKDLQSLLAHTTRLSDLVKVLGEEEQGWGYRLNAFEKGSSVSANEIRAHLKEAFFRPYLPGSSLKGAIRTVLLADWVKQQGMTAIKGLLPTFKKNKAAGNKKNEAAEELSKKCFGDTPNFDWLRALHVSDVLFDSQDLTVTDVRYLNLRGQPPQAHSKDMGSRPSQHDWRGARGIFAESLQPQVGGVLTLQIDHFLFDNPQAQSILKWQSPRLFKDFSEFRTLLNSHAQRRLTAESQFFRQYGVSAAAQECEKLLQHIKTDGTPAAYLQVGWGNGWRGMTGDWMDDEITWEIRQLYRLGRDGMIFPKTRRLIVQAGQPRLPFGWLRILSPEESNLWLQVQQAKVIQVQQEKAAIERQAIAEAERKAELSSLERSVKAAIERQAIAEAERKAKLSPLERSVEEVIAATSNQARYISLLQALNKGQWESMEDKRVVAQMICEQMKKEKVWKETTQAKKPERDKDYQRTLEVLKILKSGEW